MICVISGLHKNIKWAAGWISLDVLKRVRHSKKGSRPIEAARNIRSTYKKEAPSILTCQRWFKQFESANCFFVDSPRSGRPSSVNLCEAGVPKLGVGTPS